jgi:hypothetical protein
VRKSEKVSVDEASLGIRLFLTKLPQANLSNYRNENFIIKNTNPNTKNNFIHPHKDQLSRRYYLKLNLPN